MIISTGHVLMDEQRRSSWFTFPRLAAIFAVATGIGGVSGLLEGLVVWVGVLADGVELYKTLIREPLAWLLSWVWPSAPRWAIDAGVVYGFLWTIAKLWRIKAGLPGGWIDQVYATVFRVRQAHADAGLMVATVTSFVLVPAALFRILFMPVGSMVGQIGFLIRPKMYSGPLPRIASKHDIEATNLAKQIRRNAMQYVRVLASVVCVVGVMLSLNHQLKTTCTSSGIQPLPEHASWLNPRLCHFFGMADIP